MPEQPGTPCGGPTSACAAVSRRGFLAASAAAGAGAATLATQAVASSAAGDAAAQPAAPGATTVQMTVNGAGRSLTLDPCVTLLDALRDQLDLTGSKKGCDHGQCGACTVLVNGRRINSCLTLAVMHEGDSITTIEGLGTPEALHPMQAAFVRHDGFQCGFCTPGQICSSVAMLQEIRQGVPSHATADLMQVRFSDAEVRERMAGNLCRCAAYPNIVAAIRDAAGART
ncbi:2Fe-2S iron-sulfur cluster-binding protein [Pseudorhodoferax soli]|uniref:Xanthine dehydrogenase YagT iron-sulfur-binding subunit n=1 Tax=Pseudorhodoferax soli TaxID=545864 RepID=A0A368XZI7_9BURK|nr:2Fe-2S iron-sulfur cluster-binding protein [Pseudorhodoferax soli]RCW72458.1 xanthine dehydrogenase YagT iron-sulfur-binding subunit [Pseudorhodoferax soli]